MISQTARSGLGYVMCTITETDRQTDRVVVVVVDVVVCTYVAVSCSRSRAVQCRRTASMKGLHSHSAPPCCADNRSSYTPGHHHHHHHHDIPVSAAVHSARQSHVKARRCVTHCVSVNLSVTLTVHRCTNQHINSQHV